MVKNIERLVHIVSLGCPKNFVDTEVMAAALLTRGFGITPDETEADVYMINTCAFLPSARAEAEEFIREALTWKKSRKNRRVIIAGCLNQWDAERTYEAKYPAVDLWIGVNEVPNLGDILAKLFAGEKSDYRHHECSYLYNEKTPRVQLTLPHYAYIKISEGCDNCCSYCSIPRIRGRLRSRSEDSIIAEAKNLIAGKVKELILIGQDITAFGIDNGKASLASLLRRLDALDGDFAVRLLYTHPAHFTDELIDVIAASGKILHYIDMPLQHIADPILTSMGRKVSRSQIETLLAKLRQAMPDIAIRTTFITGYPGETEACYRELYDFVQAQEFRRVGVFAYCEEPQTRAIALDHKVSAETAASRCGEIMELQAKISLKFNNSLVGKDLSVIIDSFEDRTTAVGRTYMDAPDIDNLVYIANARRVKIGDRVMVTVSGGSDYDLEAKIIAERKK